MQVKGRSAHLQRTTQTQNRLPLALTPGARFQPQRSALPRSCAIESPDHVDDPNNRANSFWLWRSLPRVGKVFSLAIHDGTTGLRFWRTSEYGICTFQRIQQPATRRFSAHCVANSEFRFSYKRTFMSFSRWATTPRIWCHEAGLAPPGFFPHETQRLCG